MANRNIEFFKAFDNSILRNNKAGRPQNAPYRKMYAMIVVDVKETVALKK